MQQLLETYDLRKINILFELSLDLEPVNMYNLAKQLGVNIKTLLSTIHEINKDAEFYQLSIQIQRIGNQLKLEVATNISIASFKLKYLKKSMSYQILDATFNLSNLNVHYMAENYHFSVASLYRRLSKIKEILAIFYLEFETGPNLSITGSEKQIRFFFFQFYWHSSQLFEWPFTQELKHICSMLYEKVFHDQLNPQNIMMKEKIILWLGINVTRIQGGYPLSSEDVSKMEPIIKSSSTFKTLKRRFNNSLVSQSIMFEEYDFIVFYCLLICDEDYIHDNELTFFPLPEEDKTIVEEAALLFLTKLTKFVKRPLSEEKQHILYKKLLKIHMYAIFFPQKELLLTLDQHFDYFKQSYEEVIHQFDQFYQELYLGQDRLRIFSDNPSLYQTYMLLLANNLDIRTFYPEITIALLTLDSKVKEPFYQQKIQSLTTSFIHFVDNITDSVDLVISNSHLGLVTDVNGFVLNSPVTPWDWERLKLELESIQNFKYESESL